jgi:hypothetical protein
MLSSIPGRGVLLSTGTADDKPFDAHQNQGLPSTFIVKILQPSGSTLTLDAAQRSTIADIKADIERLAGIQAQLQTLYVSSSPEPLESGSPVKQYANGDDDLELTLIVVPFAPTGTFWWASDSFAQTNFRRPEWFHFEPVVAKHQGGEGAVVGAEEAGPAKKLTLKEKMAANADAKKKKAVATADELKKEAEAKAKEAQSNLGEHPQGPEHPFHLHNPAGAAEMQNSAGHTMRLGQIFLRLTFEADGTVFYTVKHYWWKKSKIKGQYFDVLHAEGTWELDADETGKSIVRLNFPSFEVAREAHVDKRITRLEKEYNPSRLGGASIRLAVSVFPAFDDEASDGGGMRAVTRHPYFAITTWSGRNTPEYKQLAEDWQQLVSKYQQQGTLVPIAGEAREDTDEVLMSVELCASARYPAAPGDLRHLSAPAAAPGGGARGGGAGGPPPPPPPPPPAPPPPGGVLPAPPPPA